MTIDARLEEIMDVLISLARNDFSRRASFGDGTEVLDGIAAGVNMLAEEIARQGQKEQELRRRAAHAERLVMLGQMAAGVAHEINNPAAFVVLNLKELEEMVRRLEAKLAEPEGVDRAVLTQELSDARAMLADGVMGIQRIASIVRELHTFARHNDAPAEVVLMSSVVDDATRIVAREIAYRARLVVDADPTARVRGDRTQLCQILTNLLLNAAQAIPEGDPNGHRIEVVVRGGADEVVTSVHDTGVGIPEDVRAHLFEPFYTTKASSRGTGLGLTISNEIARQHRGSLRCADSKAGEGTTFEVRLPAAAATRWATPAPSRSEPRTTDRRRVLVVDDEPVILHTYKRVLQKQCDVVTAKGGHEALQVLEADDRFDAIICDLMMPELDGVSVHEWLAAHRPRLVPRVVFSSGGAFTGRCQAFLATFQGPLLEKPMTRQDIMTAIDRVAR
ncbi:MAG: response regulator [Sandaracinaceae bacterium]|nr:response regulator [Sandaracinaceae bacterium]